MYNRYTYDKSIFYRNEQKKTREAYTARSTNINFECGPQVEKGWTRLVYSIKVYRMELQN
jgi:hypothetical protein